MNERVGEEERVVGDCVFYWLQPRPILKLDTLNYRLIIQSY